MRRRRAAHLLMRHFHIVVAEGQSDGQTPAGADAAEQDVRSSVTSLLPGHSHAQDGSDAIGPRQQNGAGVRDDDDDVAAHLSDGGNQRVLFGGQR